VAFRCWLSLDADLEIALLGVSELAAGVGARLVSPLTTVPAFAPAATTPPLLVPQLRWKSSM